MRWFYKLVKNAGIIFDSPKLYMWGKKHLFWS